MRQRWRSVRKDALHDAYGTVRDGAKRSRAWAVPARLPDRVLHHSEATGGHAEAVGDGARLGSSQRSNRTRCCTIRKHQCLKPSETGRPCCATRRRRAAVARGGVFWYGKPIGW
ncbi:MAG: hypothetical protein LBD24_04995 [Spirochaetaceae bacterium]|nr:hypothetical protein [Spirochaetaceae bacterium]